MLSAESPLFIDPLAVPRMAPWLWQFWRHCTESDYMRGLAAVAALNHNTMRLWDEWQREGVGCELHREGLLFIFLDPAKLRATHAEFALLRQFGYTTPEILDGAGARRMEPSLSERVVGGFLVAGEYHVRPETFSAGLLSRLEALGVEVQSGVAVTGWDRDGGQVLGIRTSRGSITADRFVVAAGSWTGLLTQMLGVKLPMQAGKGYSLTISQPSITLGRPLYLGDAKIGVSPFDGALRFAGTMELSGINLRLDPRRMIGLRRGIDRYFRQAFPRDAGEEWVGMRPLTPDGLPIIGRLRDVGNVYVASGHAMLGITLAPSTAEVIADLVTLGTASLDIAPFAAGRFL